MRLDKYLVSAGYFTTRQKAKDAIKRGFILVNGVVVKKPSKNVRGEENINVLCKERPKGYWKLKLIDGRFGLLNKNDVVLDIGSSAGGFLMYSAERCRKVFGIEISEEFKSQLEKIKSKYNNVEIMFEDVFKIDPEVVPEFDVMLVDLTLDPFSSFKAMSRLLHKRRDKGRILFVAKGVKLEDVEECEAFLEKLRSSNFSDLYSKKSRELKVKAVTSLDKNECYLLLE